MRFYWPVWTGPDSASSRVGARGGAAHPNVTVLHIHSFTSSFFLYQLSESLEGKRVKVGVAAPCMAAADKRACCRESGVEAPREYGALVCSDGTVVIPASVPGVDTDNIHGILFSVT